MTLWPEIIALGSQLGQERADAAARLLAPLHDRPEPGDVTVLRDLAYGPHERHRLDLYRPRNRASDALPLLLYVCGGGFVGGDKQSGPYFDNIGLWAAQNGIVTASINYRLAPDHPWPAGAQDVAAALAWLASDGAGETGAVSGICLMGHSAGAAHVAAFLAHPEFQTSAPAVSAGILISGLYDILAMRDLRPVPPYYGSDPALYAGRSAIPQIKAVTIPVAVVISEFDPPPLQHEACRMITALTERDDTVPPVVRLARHNHFSGVFAVGTEYGRTLEDGIREMVARHARGAIDDVSTILT